MAACQPDGARPAGSLPGDATPKGDPQGHAHRTDRNDARGMAQVVRTGRYRAVHVKPLPAQEARALLSARQLPIRQAKDVGLSLRGLLRNFGLKLGTAGKAGFEGWVRELAGGSPALGAGAEPRRAPPAAPL